MGRVSGAIAIAASILLLGAATAQAAATINVTTTADPAGPGSCPAEPCSLRQAVASATEGDTIQLAGSGESPVVYKLTQGTVVVGTTLTLQGDGAAATTIDGSGNGGNRILKVVGGTLDVSGVTFTGGDDEKDEYLSTCGGSCSTLMEDGGSAIFNAGATLSLEGVVFRADSSGAAIGGGVSNAGTLDMTGVGFENDDAPFGGGLFSRSGTVKADGVTFDEDGSTAFGGGAAVIYGGSAEFVNTTVVANGSASGRGGGIENHGGTLLLRNDTLSGNLRGALQTDEGAQTTVQNTILASGFSDGSDFDCVAKGLATDASTTTAKAITTDLGNNIDQDNACELDATGDLKGVDPMLGPLAENGGPTKTQALLPGSPAIDAGSDAACPGVDERGIARPQGPHCDIGAFEAPAPAPAPPVKPPAGPPPSNLFAIGKLQRDKSGLSGRLIVDASGPGVIRLSGKGVKSEEELALGADPVGIPVIPVGSAKKRLKKTGKLKLTVEVTFTPTGGTSNAESKHLLMRTPRKS